MKGMKGGKGGKGKWKWERSVRQQGKGVVVLGLVLCTGRKDGRMCTWTTTYTRFGPRSKCTLAAWTCLFGPDSRCCIPHVSKKPHQVEDTTGASTKHRCVCCCIVTANVERRVSSRRRIEVAIVMVLVGRY